jgi:hypothetical protein
MILTKEIITAFVGLFGVLIGAVIGYWLSLRRDRAQRQYEFITKKLSDFYSPLLSIRMEILDLSENRLMISRVISKSWEELCTGIEKPEEYYKVEDDRGQDFKQSINYNNKQVIEIIILKYKLMVDIFRKNIWLAEKDTQVYFKTLIEFVDIWGRSIGDAIPREALQELEHSEEKLRPLYDNLQQTFDKLRSRLEMGK